MSKNLHPSPAGFPPHDTQLPSTGDANSRFVSSQQKLLRDKFFRHFRSSRSKHKVKLSQTPSSKTFANQSTANTTVSSALPAFGSCIETAPQPAQCVGLLSKIGEDPSQLLSTGRLPLPESSPMLAHVQNTPLLEHDLHMHKVSRLEQSRLPIYIRLFAKASLRVDDDDDGFPLMEKVQEFLTSERQVMLILGDSGSGKSTFSRHLEHRLWTDYKQGGPIPLFINLPFIDRPDQDLVTKQLRANNFSDDLIQEMKQHRQLILICDGYDESRQLVNLHRTNMLNQPGQWNTKMVVSCRTQFLGPTYLDRFKPQPIDRYASGLQDLFQEVVITPFSKYEIDCYVHLYVQDPDTALLFRDESVWSVEEYMTKLMAIPNVNDLAKNPFLLTLALKALPRLVASNKDLSSIIVTRVGLYDMFVDQWLETNRLRLQTNALTNNELKAFNALVDDDFIGCGIDYLLRLSAAIFQEQDGNPIVQYIHRHDRDSWKAAFFGTDPEVNLLRAASPLVRTGNRYQFVHRSMLEYFFSRVIYNPVKIAEKVSDSQSVSASLASLSSNTSGFLFQRNLLKEPLIVQFLCDRVRLHADFEQQLRSIIDQSKTDSNAALAATNAITILVRAGAHFNGADLRGIRIPGADLSGGQFDSTKFEGADLTGVNLSRSWIRQADFSHAQLEGVQFGELPYLKEEGHIEACIYSPNGRMLGVALWENNLGVSIYDTFSWQRIHLITGTLRVRAIAFSPDSQHILSGDDGSRVMLWDCTSGEKLLVMKGHTDGVTSLAFSHCGKQIASGSTDDTVRLWDSQTGAILFVLKGHTMLVSSVRFSPHGHQLVSGSWDGTVRFWHTETGEAGVVWSPSLGEICNLDISPDGQWIVSGHKGGDLRLWDAASGHPGLVLRRHSETILGVAFSSNGQLIASSCMGRKVFLWDASTGDVVSTFGSRSERISGVAFSPDGLTIAMGSYEKRVLLSEVNSSWSNIKTQDQIDGASIVAYSSDGLSIISVNGGGIVRAWDAKTGVGGSVLFELPSLSSITTLGISWDSNRIATGCGDGSVRLWDSSTGATGPILKGHWMTVKNLACSACGRWIASSDFRRDVRLWDLHDLGQQYILVDIRKNSDYGGIAGLTFSPTGHELAVGSGDGKVWVFDPRTRGLLMCKRLKKRLSGVMEYSPNGQQLGLVTQDSVVFWDLHSDERCSEMKVLVNSRTVYGVFQHIAYSPCGQFLVSSNSRRIIHLWHHRRLGTENLESWSCIFVLRVFHTDVRSLSWNPIVPMEFVTATRDGSVRVWRVSSDDGGVSVKMLWGSNVRILCATSVVLEGATGLSPTHQKLLDLRKAFDRVHSWNPIFLRLLAKGGGSVDRGPSSEDKRSHHEIIEWSTVEFDEVSEEKSLRV